MDNLFCTSKACDFIFSKHKQCKHVVVETLCCKALPLTIRWLWGIVLVLSTLNININDIWGGGSSG